MIALWVLACEGGGEGRKTLPYTGTPETPTVTDTGTIPTKPPPPPPPPPPPAVCDAGDEAWVARALPLVLGRRALGSEEVRRWVEVVGVLGRAEAVRVMARTPDHATAWGDWLTDQLYVARTGDKEFGRCFKTPLRAVADGALAAHLRDAPRSEVFPESFNMSDVVRDAVAADDLSVVYRAYLFARMDEPTVGANVSREDLEDVQRKNFGELFLQTYLNRNFTCMACHNSEFSVTDDPDPALDRTWQMPGYVETAVFGAPYGPADPNTAYAMFMRNGVASSVRRGGVTPWGMDPKCGALWPQPEISDEPDWLGVDDRFLVDAYGPDGSVWDVEDSLHQGVDALRGGGLAVGADGSVGGADGLAWLLAATVAEDVWREATGAGLTVAHGFPRNEGQRDVLQHLADVTARSGFSLRELLVAVTAEPAFNAGSTCGADPYGLPALFDPFTKEDDDPARRGNGPGDLIHAHSSRTLLRSTHRALGWPPAPTWFSRRDLNDDKGFQGSIGVFLRESEPASTGSDFQTMLTFESRYGRCARPPDAVDPDLLDGLLAIALADGWPAGDVVSALRDRLLLDGTLAPDEVTAVEALLGQSLADPVPVDPAFRERLGGYCGALLLAPSAWLSHEVILGAPPLLVVDDPCPDIAAALVAAGHPATCTKGSLTW